MTSSILTCYFTFLCSLSSVGIPHKCLCLTYSSSSNLSCMVYKYRIAGKFGELTCFEHLVKESWANYRSAFRLLIVSTNLDGFSLMNRGRFAKFAKLSPHQAFPLCGSKIEIFLTSYNLCHHE